jgi:hypothetical protein
VTTQLGTSPSTTADHFSYLPTVTKVSPTNGPEAGGTTVTITGTNLTGATEVYFGTSLATKVTVKSATSLTAVSPAGEGEDEITVITPGGTSSVTAATQFSYVAPPSVTSVSPSIGPAAGGNEVEVAGSGFALGKTATTFDFGTTKATSVDCITTSECTMKAPKHAAGTVDVKATVDKVVSSASPPEDQYTYE